MLDHQTKRLSRLVALLTLLQTKRLFTASELANRFGVSVRTIYRDLKTLEKGGIPLLTQEGKGYSLLEGYRLPPVMLTEQEANAIVTAQQLILLNKDASLVAAYAEAVQKIKAVLSINTRDKANLLASRIKTYPPPPPTGQSHYLSTLQSALTNYQLVEINYQSTSSEPTCRQVEPFALLFSTQADWLLVGWCHLRKRFRIFRLDRIQSLSVLPQRFAPHRLTLKQYFDTLTE
jgi:predicted DNA-binding transcriptional regulator YafY